MQRNFNVPINTNRIPTTGLTPESGTAFPVSPSAGLMFYHTTNAKMYVWNGASWMQCDNNGVAAAVHIHAIADVTGLQAALDAKAALAHTHAQADVTGLVAALAGKAATVHTHAIGDVTNLQTTLDGKSPVGHQHAISDTTGLQAALDAKTTPAAVTTAINSAITALVNGAGTTLDTLNELAAALGNDPNFATTIATQLATKSRTVGANLPAIAANASTVIAPASLQGFNAAPANPADFIVQFQMMDGSGPVELDWSRVSGGLQVSTNIAIAANTIRVICTGTI